MPRPRPTPDVDEPALRRVPVVGALADAFARAAAFRPPLGLLALLPVAVALDLFDVGDEVVGGPFGMALAFVLESAFLLGVTGRATYAFGFAGVDLLPVVDAVPFATLALLAEIARHARPLRAPGRPIP